MIKVAEGKDFYSIMEFYYNLIDSMKNTVFKPGWEKDIYPSKGFIKKSIEENEMVIEEIDNKIAGAMVMNSDVTIGYENIKWNIEAKKEELIVLHALGTSFEYQGQGIARKMVNYAMDFGRKNKKKVIRLDVLVCNIPAQKLYEASGFKYIDKVKLYYEDTGLTDFLLYELVLD